MSGRLLEEDMSLLLRWHSQHRSVMGLEHTIHGRSWSHRLRKVEAATHLCSDSLIASCFSGKYHEHQLWTKAYQALQVSINTIV